MATSFPTALDNFTNPSGLQSLSSGNHSQLHGDLNDAAEALEAKVGVNSSAVVTSHDYFLAALARLTQGFRLTTETGVPVSSSDRTAQATLYLTPDVGGAVGLYDGTRWGIYSSAEVSLALSGLTTDKNYDVFVYWTGSAVALELSAAWTNDSTRADALARQDGVLVKSGTVTRRWVGTIRTTGTTTTEDSVGKRFVWNFYNQVLRKLFKTDSTFHTITSVNRKWNAADTTRAYWVNGFFQNVSASIFARMRYATIGTNAYAYVDFDNAAYGDGFFTGQNSGHTAGSFAAILPCPAGYHIGGVWEAEFAGVAMEMWDGSFTGAIWG